MKKILSLLLDLLFPPRCLFCGEVVPIPHSLCEDCKNLLLNKLDSHALCPLCGKPKDSCICYQTNAKLKCVSVFCYDDETFGLFKSLKNNAESSISKELAEIMVKRLMFMGYKTTDFDFVTAVPASKIRMDTLKFNHAELLAREIEKITTIPYIQPPITLGQSFAVQHSLTREQRYQNAVNAYLSNPNRNLSGNILLIDDIITTGATLKRCSDILYSKGAESVLCLTAATTLLKQ